MRKERGISAAAAAAAAAVSPAAQLLH